MGPFQIESKVGQLAYKLKIPPGWKIHPVFSVTQLEPAPTPTKHPLSRPYPTYPLPEFVDRDIDSVKSFEIKRLLNRKIIKRGCGNLVEYLVC